jgi:23S rRNA (adenine-N6)-dimethyltransferase
MLKLLHERPNASEIYLLLQREAAMKYSGQAGETVQSLLAKPFFSFEMLFRPRRTDFDPVPDVDTVFLRVVKLPGSALKGFIQNGTSYAEWESFVRLGFCSWRPSLRLAFRREFSYRRWKRLARELGFTINARPSEVTFEQWAALFREFKSGGS